MDEDGDQKRLGSFSLGTKKQTINQSESGCLIVEANTPFLRWGFREGDEIERKKDRGRESKMKLCLK